MHPPNGAPQSQTIVHRSGPGSAVQPTAPAPAPAVPAVDPLAEAKKYRDEGAALRDAAEKRARTHAVEARKFAEDKKGIGAKLSEYETLKKQQAESARLDSQAKLNKAAFLKAKFGDDWYEQIVNEKLNGGAPTADTVGLEVERAKEELRKEFATENQKREEAAQQATAERTAAELRNFTSSAVEFAKVGVKDFPALEDEFGSAEEIGAALVRVIRSEHERTTQRDESGAIVRPGQVLSLKEAAEGVEKWLLSRSKKLLARDKYRAELTGEPKPANTSPVGGGPQLRSTEERRTLSNGLSATSPGQKRTTRTDEERRAAAFAAVDRVKGV